VSKRAAERKIKRLPIFFSVTSPVSVSADPGEEYRGMSSDFSITGLFIRTRKILKPGTKLKMAIEVNESTKIHLTGTVARAVKLGAVVFKDGIGVKLTEATPEYKNFIDGLLRE
jgi:Tfp pilus assembly protein PilZ